MTHCRMAKTGKDKRRLPSSLPPRPVEVQWRSYQHNVGRRRAEEQVDRCLKIVPMFGTDTTPNGIGLFPPDNRQVGQRPY